GIHTADGRTVVVLEIARSNALQEGDPLRLLPVEGAENMTGVGSRGGQNSLELQRRDHIREAAITQVFLQSGIEDLVSRCEDDRAYVQLKILLCLQVVDRVGLASGLAKMTITTDPATQTAFGLGNRLFGGVAGVDFAKRPPTCYRIERGHGNPALHENTSRVHIVFRVI